MATIGESAKDYEPIATTKNIADLEKVSTSLELIDDEFEFTDKVTGQLKKVQQQVIAIDGVNYRVPKTVIQQLQILLEDNPNLKFFKVKKTGEGKDNTRYQVIPLMATE